MVEKTVPGPIPDRVVHILTVYMPVIKEAINRYYQEKAAINIGSASHRLLAQALELPFKFTLQCLSPNDGTYYFRLSLINGRYSNFRKHVK